MSTSEDSDDDGLQLMFSKSHYDISKLLREVRDGLSEKTSNMSDHLKQRQQAQIAEMGEITEFNPPSCSTPELSEGFLKNVDLSHLHEITPRALLMFCPTHFNMKQALLKLKSPLCLIYGERQLKGPRR